MNRIPVLLDGDPGHDDAIAWMLAASDPRLDIRGVTSVCGNQTIEKTTYNAQRICALLGLRCPVAMGKPAPLLAPPMNAPSVHGQSGLDGPTLPEPDAPLSPLRSVGLMQQVLDGSPTPVTIVATGPLTNVAALLLAHPELKPKIARISIMGGGISHGNWTPAAEFNILVDPEAAQIVFASGVPLLMSGLDVTERALIYPEDFARVRAVGNRVARVVADWLEFFYRFHRELGYAGAPLHDPVAVVALLHPELLTAKPLCVEIETRGEYCRGATIGHDRKPANALVHLDIDRDGFADLLVRAVGAFGEE